MTYFRTPRITAYAIRCGGGEIAHNIGATELWRVTLWYEHGVYHVRGTVWDHHYDGGRPWEGFKNLKEARKYMTKLCREWATQIG